MLGIPRDGQSIHRSRSLARKAVLFSLVGLISLLALPSLALGAGADILVWTTKAPMPAPQYYPLTARFVSETVNQYGTDMIFFIGGADVNETNCSLGVKVYNTATDSWSYGPLLPSPVYAAGSVSSGMDIWIFGGLDAPGGNSHTTDRVLKYDTNSTTVAAMATLPDARARASACLIGNVAYIVGGHDASGAALDTIISYNITNGNTQIVLDANGNPLHIPLAVKSPIVFDHNGEVYCFGGIGGVITGWKWDPANPGVGQSGFTSRDSMLQNGTGLRAHAMGNNKVYVTGGGGGTSHSQEYDITGDQWYFATDPPHLRRGAGQMIGSGKLWAIGGWTTNNNVLVDYNDMAQIIPTLASGNGSVSGGTQTVPVSVGSNTVNVGFDAGTGGDVSVSEVALSSLPPNAQDGFQVDSDPSIFDIITSSTGWNTLTIRLPYFGTTSPVVKHWNGSSWSPANNITSWQAAQGSTPGHVEFTWTGSLSPFSVEETSSTSTPASTPWSLTLLAACGLGAGVWLHRRRLGSSH
jgi:hypothetical protein